MGCSSRGAPVRPTSGVVGGGIWRSWSPPPFSGDGRPAFGRRDPRLPLPGTILVRGYRGRTRQVKVLEQGFEYDGQSYGSLTAVTKQITGQHWNGYHFFGLSGGKNQL